MSPKISEIPKSIDVEHRKCVQDILRLNKIQVKAELFKAFMEFIISYMTEFQEKRQEFLLPKRRAHEILHDIVKLAERIHLDYLYDNVASEIRCAKDIRKLRRKLAAAPPHLIERHKEHMLTNLEQAYEPRDLRPRDGSPNLPHIPISRAERDALHARDMSQIFQHASGRALLTAVSAIPGGVAVVEGRTRPGGKRSMSTTQPMIHGVVKKVGVKVGRDGRPSDMPLKHELIGQLCRAWTRAAGQVPELRREGGTGPSDLIHTVFQWLGMERSTAITAIRSYLERHGQPPPLED